MNEALRYWIDNAKLDHITPPGVRWPEGFAVHLVLRDFMPSGRVLDFGCGDGRMVDAFEPDRYIGVDVNPHAVAHCRRTYPKHRFEVAAEVLPHADAALCYTVLLHVPDEDLAGVVKRLAAAVNRVVVVEILGRKWRGTATAMPRVFQREADEYEEAFAVEDFAFVGGKPFKYNRYGGVQISALEFKR